MSKVFRVSAHLTLLLTGFSLLSSCDRQREVEARTPAQDSQPPQIVCLGKIVVEDGAVKVAAPAQAIISELRVLRGSHVRPGEIVAVLQTHTAWQAALQEAESQVAVAESALRQVRTPEKTATLEAQRTAIERQQTVADHA